MTNNMDDALFILKCIYSIAKIHLLLQPDDFDYNYLVYLTIEES